MGLINQLTLSTGLPRWMYLLCAAVVAVVVVWVLVKILKWALLLALGVMVVALILGGLLWLFG